jgi:hypothetical protein
MEETECLISDGSASDCHSNDNDDEVLDNEELDARRQAEEFQVLQAELSQRPKCTEFKFDSPKIGKNLSIDRIYFDQIYFRNHSTGKP